MKDALIMRVFHHIQKRKELQDGKSGKIWQSEIVEIPDNK